eukprot:11076848-Lingulodinium_polyedra.AAC.2
MTTATASCESLRTPRSWNDAPTAMGRKRAAAPLTATLSPMRSAGEAKTSHNASASVVVAEHDAHDRRVHLRCWEAVQVEPQKPHCTLSCEDAGRARGANDVHVADDHVRFAMAARLHIEPRDHSVHLSSDGDTVDHCVAVQGHNGRLRSTAGHNGRLRSTAEAPYAQVVVDLGEAHAVAEGLLQDVSHVDFRFAEALPKRAELARKEEVSVSVLDDPGAHPPKVGAVPGARPSGHHGLLEPTIKGGDREFRRLRSTGRRRGRRRAAVFARRLRSTASSRARRRASR